MFDETRVSAITDGYLAHGATLGANPDINKLLVEPLYDGNSSFGVRELIANAVDACMERKKIDGTQGDIIVTVDTTDRIFTITDNGIGMNEDILCNYFMIAGSSYRYSHAWREKFIEEGGEKSTIIRNGRFGIGALTVFLIGDEVTVNTRHLNDEKGYEFTYNMEPCVLNVQRVTKDEVGTTMKIKMHDRVVEDFQIPSKYRQDSYSYPNISVDWYEWYHYAEPQVRYYKDQYQIENDSIFIRELFNNAVWHDIKDTVFSEIKLCFNLNQCYTIVNGIVIEIFNPRLLPLKKWGYITHEPSMSIKDYYGDTKLTLNLRRTEIIDFIDKVLVIEETYKHCLAQLLMLPVSKFTGLGTKSELISSHIISPEIALNEKGFTICAPSFLYHAKQKQVFLLLVFRPIQMAEFNIKLIPYAIRN